MSFLPQYPSSDFDAQTLAETERLLGRLKSSGIDEVRSGIEVEFGFPNTTNKTGELFEQHKQEIMQQLRAKNHNAQADEVERMNIAELWLYDAITDPRITKENAKENLLEPIMRDGIIHADDLYDSDGTLEVRIAHQPIAELLTRYKTLDEVFSRKLAKYGLTLPRDTFNHQSFSFEKNGDNTTLSEHPEYARYTPAIAAGIAHSYYQGYGLIQADKERGRDRGSCYGTLLNTDRSSPIRMAKGRVEIRDAANPYITSMLAAAGAVFALDPAYKDAAEKEIIPAKLIRKCIYQNPASEMEMIRKWLNSRVMNSGNKSYHPTDPVLNFGSQEMIERADLLAKHESTFANGGYERSKEGMLSFINDQYRQAPLLSDVDKSQQLKIRFALVNSVLLQRNYADNEIPAAVTQQATIFKKVLTPAYREQFDSLIEISEYEKAHGEIIIRNNQATVRNLHAAKLDTPTTTGVRTR